MTQYSPLSLGTELVHADSFHHLTDEDDILTIYFGSTDNITHALVFDTYLAFRKIHESYALRLMTEIAKTSSLEEHLFESEGSEFEDWFVLQAGGLADDMKIRTYTITCQNEAIEVLSEELPVLRYMAT